MKVVLTHENAFSFPRVGAALEADKKINLALKVCVIVSAPEASWATTQRRPLDVRSHDLHPSGGVSLARSAGHLWTLEFGLHALATLVPEWLVGQIAAGAGTPGHRQTSFLGREPYQGASGCQQPCRRPTKSSHRAHQR